MTTPTAVSPIQSTVKTPPAAAAAPVAVPEAPSAASVALRAAEERATKAEALAAQKTREEIINRRKADSERKSWGEKLKSADEYAKLQREAGVNPAAVAKRLWGDQWHERLTAVQVNGGAPTADSVAFELEQRDAAMEKKFADREAAQKEAQANAQREAETSDRNVLGAETTEFYKAVASEYALDGLGDERTVAGILANSITGSALARYRQALQLGDADARVSILRKAAEGLESTIAALSSKVASHSKYADKFREQLTPAKPAATVPPVKSSQVSQQVPQLSQPARRTLTTDLTGTTPSESSKYRSDDERLKAALARYAENASKT